ncbi:ROK family transcriptional regulator [Rhizobium sp. C1]|uniref:ROK family transcriptional regulator n=1 Tax=Rhizobium sp. C1 TaxID=1349799 RepID=UPI001E5BBBF1|nr:ROK family transcriptional regulator [Rhizobium sp. C1]MCD2178180.1 ROK family transcriptional regulator [Rhizobium sp. C1]
MLTRQRPFEGIGRTQVEVLRHLRKKGSASRGDLADACGVTAAAISMMARDLIERGIVIEGERRVGARGAPHVDLMLVDTVGYTLGIHANRFTASLVLLDFRGRRVDERQRNGPFDNVTDLAKTIGALKTELLTSNVIEDRLLIGAGIAMPTRFRWGQGLLDLAEEVIGWAEADLHLALQQSLNCPIVIENDANAAAMGEVALGNSSDHANFVYLYLSEGIGSGVIINKELYRGHTGNAGEVGALRARGLPRPSFEDLANWCLARIGQIPDGRSGEEWTTFLENHGSVLNEWVKRAGPETAALAFMATAILAPSAIYLGGTLPWIVRTRLAEWLDFRKSDPFSGARVLQPDIIVPEQPVTDAVAFGAAAMILHDLPGSL